jgi:septal ring-binding cell division protein DamX
MNKLTLQALALSGILAVSGLPAFAADMAPSSPAPNASVSTDTKADVGSSVDSKAKTAIDKNKTAAEKNVDKTSKNVSKDKKKVQQTAAKPVPNASAGAGTSVGAGNAGLSGAAGAAVLQH